MHHPDAFATLDEAFDPQANAQYAAVFLQRLHVMTGDWSAAAAAYHSMTLRKSVRTMLGASPPSGRQPPSSACGQARQPRLCPPCRSTRCTS
ncbi:MAG: transglycosylase SLT domain-containing protein [Acetobacteraceae bacterium]